MMQKQKKSLKRKKNLTGDKLQKLLTTWDAKKKLADFGYFAICHLSAVEVQEESLPKTESTSSTKPKVTYAIPKTYP